MMPRKAALTGGEGVFRASLMRDAAWLGLLCALMYFPGLTGQGLVNWQESQRVLVAREMLDRGEWIVPTRDGAPYLAKPPLMYWCQMALALGHGALTGSAARVDEWELRLTVALAGLCGVLAGLVFGGRMLRDEHDGSFGDRAAWWSALGLATGVLYVRASRTGELDILLVPFVVIGVGCVVDAWRSAEERGRVAWWSLIVGALAAAGAALTKGPPGVLVIGAAAYGSQAWMVARGVRVEGGRARRWVGRAAAALGAVGAAVVAWSSVNSADNWLGVGLLAVLGGMMGWGAVWMCAWGRVRAVLVSLSKTHPVLVLGAGFLALWGWGELVSMRIGDAAVLGAAGTQLEDNLQIFEAPSPIRNLGFLAYGLGVMSVVAGVSLVWIVRERPRIGRYQVVPFVWLIGGFVIFSVFGKGVARYLNPVWPGLAMVGGMGLVWMVRAMDESARVVARRVVIVAMIGGGLGQSWWYGWGRGSFNDEYSPRAFVCEMLAEGVDPTRVGTWAFDAPAVAFYLDQPTRVWGPRRTGSGYDELEAEVVGSGRAYVMLVRRESSELSAQRASPEAELERRGLRVRVLPIEALYVRERCPEGVRAIEVLPPREGERGDMGGGGE